MQLFIGFLVAAFIAFLAYKVHSLNKSGALAATLSGAMIFGMGGWRWAVLLLAFFITSSALSRAFKHKKKNLDEKFSKGSERDAGQVFGNGGVATFFAALIFFQPNEPLIWLGFAASLAAVNADTWATELGVLNPHPPRMITNLSKVVEKGTSGGVSLIGTLASLAGAAFIAALASFLTDGWSLFLPITFAGLAGSLFDSLLGSTVQAIYYCPTDQKETEQYPLHTCGTQTSLLRGWPWLNNDLVNLACAAFAVGVAFLLTVL
ncbi:MAG: DUF92 domain-containing protein [Anaerolineales bacterium]|nr:DUF92 domain-containing protein [Anaerolineales bacterium]